MPAISAWSPLGGPSPASSPVVAGEANGVQEVAAIGAGGALWVRFQDAGGNATAWSNVGGACVSIAATTNGAGLADVFASFTNGQVWEFAHNNSGFNWVNLGGSAAGPIAAATEAGGAEQVCSVGTDGGLWVSWVDANGGKTGWADVGGACVSLAASPNGAGLVDAFAGFADGTVREFAHTATGFSWVNLGGSAAGPIAAAVEAGGAEQIAAVGQDGGLWLRWVDANGGQTGWADVGGGPARAVAVAPNSAGLVDTFVALADGTVAEFAHPSAPTFSWVNGLGNFATGLAAGIDSQGREDLFAVAPDGSLWARQQQSPGNWATVFLALTGTPSHLVGDPVTWSASIDGYGASTVYQFLVGPGGGPYHVVQDFGASSTFTWAPMQEGTYSVEVIAEDAFGDTASAVSTSATFVVNSRVTGSSPVVTALSNPLVALFSAPPAPAGVTSMYVQFGPAGPNPSWQPTDTLPVVPGQSTNFIVAGMLPNTTYQMRDVRSDGTVSSVVNFTTGSLPASLSFPAFTVGQAPAAGSDLSQDMVFHSVTGAGVAAVATDLAGRVEWYFDPTATGFNVSYAPTLVPGGTVLLLGGTGSDSDTLREVDLAGNTVRQTDVGAVNAELAALGEPQISNGGFGSFHHDAQRLPNGDTAVLASTQQTINVNGTPTNYRGDMVIVLDQNFQVVWVWNPFKWLDPNRLPPLGEGPGDWMHANAITWSPEDGNLLISMRAQDWVIKIDYADGTGDGHIVWRLGAGGDFTLQSTPGQAQWFSHQHDPRFLNANTLVIFDDNNGGHAANPSAHSFGQVYVLNEQTMTATLVLNADLGNYSGALGSAQVLPNGDFVFDSGFQGSNSNPSGQSIEVTPDGTIVYERNVYHFDYRAYRTSGLYGETVTALSATADPSESGDGVTFTATVSPVGAPTPLTPGGSVTFMDGTTVLGTVALNASGVATFPAAGLAPGDHTITAVYGGSTDFVTSSSPPLDETVTP